MKFPEICFVYPTRNRPDFIRTALSFVSLHDLSDVQILIVDNSDSDNDSTCNSVQEYLSDDIRYVRTSGKLSMVENWEFALEQSRGNYVGFLTDKMFLLPGVVEHLRTFTQTNSFDVLSWFENNFTPFSYSNYFGRGIYSPQTSNQIEAFREFDPKKCLYHRLETRTPRGLLSPSEYAIGKICYGLYSRRILEEIKKKHGRVFFPVSPDYTSMVLALGTARSAYSTNFAGIVHINTDISNGNKISLNDEQALDFINTFDDSSEILEQLPVPGLYSSISNLVLNDYLSMTNKIDFSTSGNLSHWDKWIVQDLNNPGRNWSSPEIREQQFALLRKHIKDCSFSIDNLEVADGSQSQSLRNTIYSKLPVWAKFMIHRTLRDPKNLTLRSISEIVKTEDLGFN